MGTFTDPLLIGLKVRRDCFLNNISSYRAYAVIMRTKAQFLFSPVLEMSKSFELMSLLCSDGGRGESLQRQREWSEVIEAACHLCLTLKV